MKKTFSRFSMMTGLAASLLAAVALILTGSLAGGAGGRLLVAFGFLLLLVDCGMLAQQPYLLVRLIVWIFTHTLYRMTVVERERVPAKGGALLVSNTISYVDHGIIFASLKRPVRLFMGREFYEHPLLHFLARTVNAIPISQTDSPKSIGRALREARRAIQAGELVCIFAEGDVTRTGNLLPFRRGFEFIMRGLDAPIIPLHIDRMWGSTFSFIDGKLSWRLPKIIPYPVTVSFGTPLASTAKAGEVRLAVEELSADAFSLRGDRQKKLHIAFIHEVRRHPFRFCMADSLGAHLSYAKALAGMLAVSGHLFPKMPNEMPEEKVGVFLPTSCMAALVNCAVLLAGKIPVNLNYTSSRETIATCIRQCDMSRIITSRAFLERLNMAPMDGMLFLEDIKDKISDLRKMQLFLAVLLFPAALLERLFTRGNRADINDVATIIFSSGSTGEPKGVMLTHQNITSNVEGACQIFNLRPRDVVVGILPFFHSFGYMANLWLPLLAGKSTVFHTNPLEANMVGEMTQKYKGTIIMGTPTFLAAYARKCTKEQFATLRFVVAGAEKLKRNIAENFHRTFGVPPFEGYGCTELSPVVALGIPSYIHPSKKYVQVGNKPGTVGHPIPGVAAKIVDPESLEDLDTGREGLLLIKGPNVMKGYLAAPEKTAEVLRDGWYVTGDIASIDEDGFIAITDRLSRFSKIAGEMVPHIKIEEEIHAALGAESQICVVTGLSDERKGERIVVLHTGELNVEDAWNRLNAGGLPKLWLPKKENFYRIEEIPLLGSGKLDLKKVRQLAEQSRALSEKKNP